MSSAEAIKKILTLDPESAGQLADKQDQFVLALCKLLQRKAETAHAEILSITKSRLDSGQGLPDPIEWAYFVFCYLCLERPAEAYQIAMQFPEMQNSYLDTARWAALLLTNQRQEADRCRGKFERRTRPEVESSHPFPKLGFKEIATHLVQILEKYQQVHAVELIKTDLERKVPPTLTVKPQRS